MSLLSSHISGSKLSGLYKRLEKLKAKIEKEELKAIFVKPYVITPINPKVSLFENDPSSLKKMNPFSLLFLFLFISSSLSSPSDYIVDAVDLSVKLFQSIVNIFKTSVSVKIVDYLTSRGFKSFESQSTLRQLNGLRNDHLDMWINDLYRLLYIPPEYQHIFNTSLQTVLWTDVSVWNMNKVTLSSSDGRGTRMVFMFTHNNGDSGTTDWIVADCNIVMELAPNIMVFEISKSYVGGLWGSDQYVFKELPATITENNINTISDFFFIFCIRMLSLQFGHPVDYPVL